MTAKRESKIFDSKLIEEIRKYPEIFDRNHINYKNAQHRNELWEMIAKKTNNVNGEFCQNRWNILRVQFRREHKKLQKNENVNKIWKHYDALKFLVNHSREETKRRNENLSIKKKIQYNTPDIYMQPTNQILTESPIVFNSNEFLSSTPLKAFFKSVHVDIFEREHQQAEQQQALKLETETRTCSKDNINDERLMMLNENNYLENFKTIQNQIDQLLSDKSLNKQIKLTFLSDLFKQLSIYLKKTITSLKQ